MNRWTRLLLLACAWAAASAFAQQPPPLSPGQPSLRREAPRDVKPAVITVSATPPIILVDGVADRFSPGARIRDRNNMLVLTGQLAGKTLYTVYRRDASGMVHEVWLLNQDEYAKVGGVSTGDPQGYLRFYELLNLVWSARHLISPLIP
ncbi:hypothetical protein [Ramlibacter sp.]|uniref:hypothetical protein n=1 Tax=Ramlibacter sp. TaxID=1917967 RepID=UPI002FC9651E